MQRLTKFLGVITIGAVIAAGMTGCDNPAGGGEEEKIDSALVAKWYMTQAYADAEGNNFMFEITAEGKLTGEAFTAGETTVTTSNGRINATLTLNGQTMDAGSADYNFSGTELRFSNPSSSQPNYFSTLINALNASSALGGSDCFYKKAGGGSPKTLVIQNIPTGVYYYGADGGQIGVFQSGTTPQQALALTGLVAGADLSNGDIIISGSGPYTITAPLYNVNNTNRWTGSGTYDIYVILNGGGGHYYRAVSVNISSGTTNINFTSATEIL
jgi:hypothetical protein